MAYVYIFVFTAYMYGYFTWLAFQSDLYGDNIVLSSELA